MMICFTAAEISMPTIPPALLLPPSSLDARAEPVHSVVPLFRSTSFAVAVTAVSLLITM
ncbi:hypothetical protein D3C78_1738250 [compost metagenome]